jgi:glycosyltransferase involved in cell wall biosynthesis
MLQAGTVHLVIVGDGPERDHLHEIGAELGRDRVSFAGFVNIDRLADYYMAADVLVHASEMDPHPLAISEAIYTGLPIVTSSRVGSIGFADDVRPEANGLVYPAGDVDGLATILGRLASDVNRRREMSEASAEIGQSLALERVTAKVLQAIRIAARNRKRSSQDPACGAAKPL